MSYKVKIMMTLHILFIFIFFPSSTSISSTKVILGNTLLRENGYEILFNQRIGILSNPTGIYDDSLVHIVDAIYEYQMLHTSSVSSPPFELVAIFSPEHGFRGEKQAETSDPPLYIDEYTKVYTYIYT